MSINMVENGSTILADAALMKLMETLCNTTDSARVLQIAPRRPGDILALQAIKLFVQGSLETNRRHAFIRQGLRLCHLCVVPCLPAIFAIAFVFASP